MTAFALWLDDLLPLLPLAVVLVCGLIGTGWPGAWLPPINRLLNLRAIPWLVGAVTALVIAYVWGSLDAVPIIHDEAAYLLQAAMLAHGHLAGPAPPLPEFFEQYHVFVTPVLAVRYPPGFALALVPGIWLGQPGLVPVVLSGLTGALLFALARRLFDPSVALLSWLLWVVTPGNLRYRPLYLTETLSGLLWLATWWCLLEWRRTGRRSWLLGISALIGWQAITRPLTAVAFAIPIGAVVLLTTWRTRRWRDLALAMGTGIVCVAIIPYQNRLVTGNWRLTPLKHYSTVYFPADLPGFGYDSTPSQRALPADFEGYTREQATLHRDFTPNRLPEFFLQRGGHILYDTWGQWRPAFGILALIGLAGGGIEILFGTATCLVLLVSYLTFAHNASWTVYYIETEAVLVVLVALGARAITRWVLLRRPAPDPIDMHVRRTSLALGLLSLAVLSTWPHAIGRARATSRYAGQVQQQFRQKVASLPGPSIVFIRYSPTHDYTRSLMTKEPDLTTAHAWLVYDRGPENPQLMALAAGRTPYLYIELNKQMVRLNPDGTPAATPASAR